MIGVTIVCRNIDVGFRRMNTGAATSFVRWYNHLIDIRCDMVKCEAMLSAI